MQFFSRILTFSFLCLPIHILFSQNIQLQTDSIFATVSHEQNDSIRVRKLLLIWQEVRDKNPSLARNLLEAIGEEAEKTNQKNGLAYVNFNWGFVFSLEGNSPLAEAHLKKALAYFESIGDTAEILRVRSNLVNLAYNEGKYEKVIAQSDSMIEIAQRVGMERIGASFKTLKGLSQHFLGNNLLAMREFVATAEVYERVGDSSHLADAWVFLSYTQTNLKKYSVAKRYCLQAIEIYKKLNDQFFLGQVYNDLGSMYLTLEEPDSAAFYLEKSLAINEGNQFSLVATNYMNMGSVYRQRDRYEEAEKYYSLAEDLFAKRKDIRNLIDVYVNQGELLLNRKNPRGAITLLEKAERLFSEISYLEGERNVYRPMAVALERIGNWQKSALYWQKYSMVNDSLFSIESARQQNELLIVYETEKKEKALLLEKQENETLRQEAKIQALQLRIFLILGAFILGIGTLAFIIYRQKNLRKQLIQENEKKALEKELEFKQRELTTHTLHLVSKNKLLAELKESIEKLKEESAEKRPFVHLIGSIDHDMRGDNDWENFEKYFQQVHTDFEAKVRENFEDLTSNEMRLVSLMKMNLSS
ncbi:MAG: tetratricopeptide repeat protein [Bacteroidia bacterium]